MPQLKVENLYNTTITSVGGIPSSGDCDFTVAVAPQNTNGFIIISPDNPTRREIMYYHNVIGNRIYVRGENRVLPKAHIATETVKMNDVAEIFNTFSDMISQAFYVEKTGGLDVRVWGGYVYYNGLPVSVPDTNLTMTDNTTNYIKYDYPSNTFSVDTVNSGNIKAQVITIGGAITSIGYRTAKESYIDFTVAITGALPSQLGKQGKVLTTDGTDVSWESVRGIKSINISSASTINLGSIDGDFVHITGSTTITSFGASEAGVRVNVVFDGTMTLNHNATSLILPSGENIVTQIGDSAIFINEGGSNWKCLVYHRSSGLSLKPYPQIGGNGSDGTPSIGNLTITGSNDSVIIKNYVNFSIGSNTLTVTPTGCIVIIKVQGTLNLTGTTINFTGKGSLGGAGGVGTTNTGVPGANGLLSTPVRILGTVAGGGGGVYDGSLFPGGGGGGGGASIAFNGLPGGNALSGGIGGVNGINPERFTSLDFMKGTISLPQFIAQGGGGGGAGSGNFIPGVPGADGGAGGAGGGSLIFLVEGDIILSSTTINVNGVNGSNGATKGPTVISTGGGGGGGGGAGGIFVALSKGQIIGSVTPNITGGTGGTGGAATGGGTDGANGGNGGQGLYLISTI